MSQQAFHHFTTNDIQDMAFLLKLTVCWGFFALLYILLLRKETFFHANRFYLLGTLAGSMLLAAFSHRLQEATGETGIQVVALPVVSAGFQQVTEEVSQQLQLTDYVWIAYMLGVAFMLLRTVWGIVQLIQMARTGVSEYLPGGVRLIYCADVATPFSFFKWIFVPLQEEENHNETSTHQMLAHERAHAEGWHSVDIMLMEVICALFWFHPLAYWYQRSLRTVHEYLADAAASRLTDKKQYGLLLIRQSQSGMPVAFANHFFQSPLKQRLIMLMKKHSAPGKAFRYALTLPLILLFILLFQKAPALAQDQSILVIDSKNPARLGVQLEEPQQSKVILNPTECDKIPEFPGGMQAMMEFLGKNLKYPEPVNGQVEEGDIAISFTVKEDGYIKDVHLSEFKSEPALSAAYEKEALRVVSMLPRWNPGKKDCKPAAFELCIPIKYRAGTAARASKEGKAPMELFDADQPPLFPGGDSELMKYLAKNIEIPESDKKTNPSGIMVFRFIVSETGSVGEVEVVRDGGAGKATQEQIMQVVKAMPTWKPAQKDGKPIGVYFTLPVRIRME